MAVESPVSHRMTVVGLLLLTFATGLVDAVSVLVLGHVFVANMTGNVIFLGFWFVPHSGVDLMAAVVAFVAFVAGTVLGGGSHGTSIATSVGGCSSRWAWKCGARDVGGAGGRRGARTITTTGSWCSSPASP